MNTHDIDIELPPLPEPNYKPGAYGMSFDAWGQNKMIEYARTAIKPYIKRIVELEASLIAYASSEPVAYLDLGVGGYVDVGTDLTDEQLAALPKGRHMLAIVGTYGVDGYTEAAPQPAESSRGETASADDSRSCAIADSNYAAGMLTGWNLCVADDEESFNRIRGDRLRAAAQASRDAKEQDDSPQPVEPMVINAIFEICGGEIIGTTGAKVKRYELQDDGSITVVLDYWPQPAEPVRTLIDSQEPLGEEFQCVLDEHSWDLYVKTDEPVEVVGKPSVPSDDVLADALTNLEHDNYEQSYSGYKNRQADVELIRAALSAMEENEVIVKKMMKTLEEIQK